LTQNGAFCVFDENNNNIHILRSANQITSYSRLMNNDPTKCCESGDTILLNPKAGYLNKRPCIEDNYSNEFGKFIFETFF